MNKTMIEFGPSVKKINGEYLESRGTVDMNSAIVNTNTRFVPTALAMSIVSQNTGSSTYMNRNSIDVYQGLTQTDKIIRLLIGNMILSKKIQVSEDSY